MSMSFYFKHRFGFVTSQLQFEDLFWWLKEVKREKDDNPFFGKPIPLPDLTVHQTCKKPSACNIATSSFLAVSSSSSNEKNALWRPFFDVQAGFGHSIKTNRKKIHVYDCLWSMHWDTILGPMGGWSFLDISCMQFSPFGGAIFSSELQRSGVCPKIGYTPI